VSILDQCEDLFSPQHAIYGIRPKDPKSRAIEYVLILIYVLIIQMPVHTGSTTWILHGYDYSNISTIDVKRYIHDLSVNKTGSQFSTVENQGEYESDYSRLYGFIMWDERKIWNMIIYKNMLKIYKRMHQNVSLISIHPYASTIQLQFLASKTIIHHKLLT
jgi:hypothetical protein